MRPAACTLALLLLAPAARPAEVDVLIKQAREALKKGDAAAALAAATRAVEADPKSPVAVFTRGEAYAAQRKHAEAIKDFDAVLSLDKSYLLALDRRGSERFKVGHQLSGRKSGTER